MSYPDQGKNRPRIPVTIFNSFGASEKDEKRLTLVDLAELIAKETAPRKIDLPWLKLATFGNNRTIKNSLRHDGNVISISGIEVDYDGEKISTDEAIERLTKAGILSVFYTSPSHTEDAPRWRVIAPTSSLLPPAKRKHLIGRLNGVFNGNLANESWTLSQSYYYGSVNHNPSHRVEIIDGSPIDELDELDEIWTGPPETKAGGSPGKIGPLDEPSLLQAITEGRSYHEASVRLLGKWARSGVPYMDARGRLIAAMETIPQANRDARWTDRRADLDRCLDDIYGKEAKGRDADIDRLLDAAQEKIDSGVNSAFTEATTILRLAKMDTLAYGRVRKAEAKTLGISVAALDREVKAHQRTERMQAITTGARPWLRDCQYTQQGEVRPNLVNTLLPLRADPRVAKIARYDEMLRLPILMQPIPGAQLDEGGFQPRPIRDEDYTSIQEWMQREGLETVAAGTTRQAVDARARELSFHPVRDWLDSLEWDNTPRLADWLATYLGTESTEYTKAIGTMFLISMVARVRQPGCKSDYMLVLEGPQGARKSTACAILGGEHFSDNLPDIRNGKDVSQHLNGKWLIEVAELSALDKAEAAALKAFITRPVERYRRSYGHAEVVEPRQCVFIGTTNKTAYLRDETGGRRFWPVKVGKIDTDALQRDRAQLYAEADHYYQQGSTWWPDAAFEAAHIQAEQSARYEADAWEDAICEWLDKVHDSPEENLGPGNKLPRCTVLMVARVALHMETQRVGTSDQRRIIAAMERLGWEKAKRTMSGQPYKPGLAAIERHEARMKAKRASAGTM